MTCYRNSSNLMALFTHIELKYTNEMIWSREGLFTLAVNIQSGRWERHLSDCIRALSVGSYVMIVHACYCVDIIVSLGAITSLVQISLEVK
jgi:hypothetical protein